MGQLILPSGGAISIDEFHGTTELNSLVRELRLTDLSDSYRVAIIGCLARLGAPANVAISDLKKHVEGNNRILKDAAEQAIKRIESDTSVPLIVAATSGSTAIPSSVDTTKSPHFSYSANSQPKHYQGKEKTKVELLPLRKTDKLLDACPTLNKCNYCHKIYESPRNNLEISKNIDGGIRHCRFCMRNKYYKPEVTKNIVVLTYRSLIGYIYYSFVQKNQIYIGEFKDMIQDHITTSFSNPLFNYDTDTFNWYIDIEPIVNKKVTVDDIAPTIASQLSALGIGEIFYRGKPYLIYRNIISKLKSGEKFIMPTPMDGGCQINENGIPKEFLIEFVYSHLVDSTTKNARKWDSGVTKKERVWSGHGGDF